LNTLLWLVVLVEVVVLYPQALVVVVVGLVD
jgi:hypothetical protein